MLLPFQVRWVTHEGHVLELLTTSAARLPHQTHRISKTHRGDTRPSNYDGRIIRGVTTQLLQQHQHGPQHKKNLSRFLTQSITNLWIIPSPSKFPRKFIPNYV